MLGNQSDPFFYDQEKEVCRFITALTVVVPQSVGEPIEGGCFILSYASFAQLLKAVKCFGKEITLETRTDEPLDHLLHLRDRIVHTIDLPIRDHSLEVSDWIDTRDLFLRFVVFVTLAHLESLSLLFLRFLLHLLLFSRYQVLPVDAFLLLCFAFLFLNRLQVELLIKGRYLFLCLCKHLLVRSYVLLDIAIESW